MRITSIVVFVGLAVSCCSQSHELTLGDITKDDVPVLSYTEWSYGLPSIVRTSTVEYPDPEVISIAQVTAVRVEDHIGDGNGGYASITAGGIGHKFVSIKLESQRGKGFNFTVTIYGRFV